MLLRSANWDFARAKLTLTQWKAAVVNGVTSANPPPQPWLYSYLYPPDCLKARFIQPTIPVTPPGTPLTTAQNITPCSLPVPTAIPFVVSTDFDANGNPIRTILSNLQNAQLIYTRDLSQTPDLWDPLFLAGETALLASFFINALARNAQQYEQQVAITKNVLDQARVANGTEQISNIDHYPDWMRARRTSGVNWSWNQAGAPLGYGAYVGWDSISFPNGEFY